MPTTPTTTAQAAEVRGRAAAARMEFSPRKSHRPMMAELYRRAEVQMRQQPKFPKPDPNPPTPDAAPERLLHELQVHQIELELQNEELRKTRDEMEAARDKYSELYDFAPVGYLTLDRAGTITEANLAAASLLGIVRTAVVKRRFGAFVSPADRSAFAAFLQQVFQSTAREECDVRLLLKGANPVDVRMRAIVSSTGQACQVAVTDITERKQAQDALRVSEERFRAAVGVVSSLIWTNSAQGLMEGEQPGWGSFTGQTLKEYQGYGWTKAVHPQDGPPTVAAWRRAVAAKSIFEFEHRVRRRDGEWRLCSIRAVPLLHNHGQIREWVGVHTDITERKQAEETQRRVEVLAASNQKLEKEIVRRQAVEGSLRKSEQDQNRLLEQSRQMQEQLRQLSRQILTAQEEERREISRELHDVVAQTLSGINVRLAGLKQDAARNAQGLDRRITSTQRQVEKSVDIVHQFARELRPTMLDDLGLIPALHAFLKGFTARTGVRAHLTVFAEVERVDADKRTMLYRVAQEALTNVARHAKATHVAVRLQKLPSGLRMTVKDDGRSFDVARLMAASGRVRLGLIGMRERVEMVGGAFGVQSAPGHGTTIQVEISCKTIRTTPRKKTRRSKMPSP